MKKPNIMEENTKNTGHGMGVAALIIGVLSLIVAFIPCLGLMASFTAIVAVVLGAIGISQASRAESPKGLALGGLITGAVALLISIAQIVFFAGFSDRIDFFGGELEEALENVQRDVMRDFESGDFKITIEDGEDKIEIQGSGRKKDLREKLEELEGVETEEQQKQDSTEKQE